tara:strand:- start:1777 stop:3999 length:2223 start_codon:yes stop_codon:yes gene_type:complete
MSRSDAKVQVNSFQGGLVTEASDLNFPENGLKEALNTRILRDGSLVRRPGIKADAAIGTLTASLSAFATDTDKSHFKVFDWPELRAKLICTPGWVTYFKIVDGVTITRGNPLPSATDMVFSLATLDDRIIFLHDISTELDESNWPTTMKVIKDGSGEFESWDWRIPLQMKIRDFESIPNTGELNTVVDDFTRDFTALATVPRVITESQYYNYLNAGWPVDTVAVATNSVGSGALYRDAMADSLGFYDTGTFSTIVPALADAFETGRASAADSKDAVNAYSRYELNKYRPLQKLSGKFLVELDEIDTTRVANLASGNIPAANVITNVGQLPNNLNFAYRAPTACATAFGRLWIGGFSVNNLDSNIAFTQTLRNVDVDINKYYQENDPTAPEINQLLPSDGGLASIRGAGKIYDMVTLDDYLVILAENGVWSISGVDGGFAADTYTIKKVSSDRCVGQGYYTVAGSQLFFLNESHLSVITTSEFGTLKATDISSNSIKSKINSVLLNPLNTFGCTLSYDAINSTVQIDFKDYYRTVDGVQVSYKDLRYSLLFDLVNGQWSEKFRGTRDVDSVNEYVGSIYDKDATRDNPVGDNMLYLTRVKDANTVISFNRENSTEYTDLESTVPSQMLALTGPLTLSDVMSDKQISYLEIFNKNPKVLDTSSCIVTPIFNWDDTQGSPAFEAVKYLQYPAQVHHSDSDVIVTKHKVQGKGSAIQLKFENNTLDKSTHVLGYAYSYSQSNGV